MLNLGWVALNWFCLDCFTVDVFNLEIKDNWSLGLFIKGECYYLSDWDFLFFYYNEKHVQVIHLFPLLSLNYPFRCEMHRFYWLKMMERHFQPIESLHVTANTVLNSMKVYLTNYYFCFVSLNFDWIAFVWNGLDLLDLVCLGLFCCRSF